MASRRWIVFLVVAVLISSVSGFVQTQTTPPPVTPPATAPQTPPAAAAPTPLKPAAPKTAPIPPEAASPVTGWTESVIKAPIVNEASVYVPRHPTTSNIVLFISGDGGWNLGVVDMARRIMPKAIVIGISYNALRKAPAADAVCWAPAEDLKTVAQSIEKTLNLPEDRLPILIGYSSGATMVYHALAVAPQDFSGGVSLGFCPDMPSNHNVCGIEGFTPTPHNPKRNEVILPKVARLDREWFVINGILDQVCLPAAMRPFLDDMGNVHANIDIPNTGHGFTKPYYWGHPFDDAVEKLLAAATAIAKK
jgi:predicted esterase